MLVYREIKQRIAGCVLEPGAHLRAEDFATEFHVSEEDASAGLQRAAGEGLVAVEEHGRGFRAASLRMQEARELFQLRSLLGGEAAGLAATRGLELDDLRSLERCARRVFEDPDEEAVGSVEEMVEADMLFQCCLGRLCGSDRLAAALVEVIQDLKPYLYLGMELGEPQAYGEALAPVIDGVKRGDRDAARLAVRAQTALVQKHVFDALITAHASQSGNVVPMSRTRRS